MAYDDGPPLGAPLSWRLHKLWRVLRFPLIAALLVAGWIYVPVLEARSQQNALAVAFFDECKKTLKDSEQLPKVPEDALEAAIKRRPLTDSALRTWDPQVSSVIRDGQWVARIEFNQPSSYAVEQRIGPVLAESGYDTPSAGP